MLKKNIIEKALIQNDVFENDILVIKTDTIITFSIHLLRILVLLLFNFFLEERFKEEKQLDFIMTNFTSILDIVTTELEIALHNFSILYREELTDIVELHCRDECLLVLVIQEKVNKKLKEII
jgi:hypothetical protein